MIRAYNRSAPALSDSKQNGASRSALAGGRSAKTNVAITIMFATRDGGFKFGQDELKGFSRTIAEIEWLLLILVLLQQLSQDDDSGSRSIVLLSLLIYGCFVMAFRYVNLYRRESQWKLAIETWVMIAFITWVVWNTGKLASPLLNLYLLTIVTSALALGKMVTLLEMGLITACYVFLSDFSRAPSVMSYLGDMTAQLAPMVLVAYITTLFSADIHYGLNKARAASETDELTGIYNMRGFGAIVDREFQQSERYSRPFALMMIDCDNLKEVNDKYGHEGGNKLLRHLVQTVQAKLRNTDVIARYGGDEFVVLLPETNGKGGLELSERIRAAVAASQFEIQDAAVTSTVSVGITSYPDDGGSVVALLEKADKAMYRAKTGGKNRAVGYSVAA
jgi:diguanylate cyclase (GGDEF)-like protein